MAETDLPKTRANTCGKECAVTEEGGLMPCTTVCQVLRWKLVDRKRKAGG